MSAWRATAAAVVIGGLSACASFTELRSARVLKVGEWEETAAIGAIGDRTPSTVENGSGQIEGPTNLAPELTVGLRYGVLHGVDLMVKLWGSDRPDEATGEAGIELGATLQLVRGPVDVALGPGLGFTGFTSGTLEGQQVNVESTMLYLPLLVGFNFGQGNQLVLEAQLIPDVAYASAVPYPGDPQGNTQAAFGLFVGGGVGLSLQITDAVRLMPAASVYVPAVGHEQELVTGSMGTVFFDFALGFSFSQWAALR